MMNSTESLPYESWTALRNSMKRDWPKYSYFYSYLSKAIEWKTKDTLIKDHIYCPNSNANSGIFISTTVYFGAIYLFSFDESKHMLQEILRTTDKIPWNESFYFDAIHENIQDTLEKFLDSEAKIVGMRNYVKENFACYLKAKEDCLRLTVEIPEECVVKRIEEKHIPLIHSHWRYRDVKHPEKSIYSLESRVRLNGSYGLFLKADDSLVSWILQCNRGYLAVLNTLKEHRRKGYGKVVTQALARYIAEKEDSDVTLLADEFNETGSKFFESVGFKKVANVAWYGVNR